MACQNSFQFGNALTESTHHNTLSFISFSATLLTMAFTQLASIGVGIIVRMPSRTMSLGAVYPTKSKHHPLPIVSTSDINLYRHCLQMIGVNTTNDPTKVVNHPTFVNRAFEYLVGYPMSQRAAATEINGAIAKHRQRTSPKPAPRFILLNVCHKVFLWCLGISVRTTPSYEAPIVYDTQFPRHDRGQTIGYRTGFNHLRRFLSVGLLKPMFSIALIERRVKEVCYGK